MTKNHGKDLLYHMRREFAMLIDRCGCSRASITITKEEAEKMQKEGLDIKPQTPRCTPKKCFPYLYKFLYPKGGFRGKSHLIRRKQEVK